MAAASIKREGKVTGNRNARDRHHGVLKRLAHQFQDVALKLRQFVQEQHAVMSQGNFASTRHGASANQSCVANGVMRRTKWPRADKAAVVFECPCDAVDARSFDRFSSDIMYIT